MRISLIFIAVIIALSCNTTQKVKDTSTYDATLDTLKYAQEGNLRNVKQLTFGGDNAEAYFSFNGKYLTLQATSDKWGTSCDQIFYLPISGYTDERPPMVSTGQGRTTCSYFLPGDKQIVYASTHLASPECPETPRVVNGKYVWAVYESFDIFVADLNGKIIKQLTNTPGYDAEATVSPDGKKMVFTSVRSGDLELYTMNLDGTDVKQITNGLGYDGGAFFSPDSKQILFRASRPKTEEAQKNYKDLLAQSLVQPTDMELYICDVDGSNLRQITTLGGANWAPFFHPSGKKILFASNHHSQGGRQFNLFMINTDGTGLKQITFDTVFDSFPMFSPDGKKLVFASNRNNGGTRDTNVFIADWVD
ncbi:MAG: PD40 domain-containing protein [Saprospiraceae bacterium]|nr:PD40 domain-containing protein [Saprospiraceae bacterium]